MLVFFLQGFFAFLHITGNGSFPSPLSAEEESLYLKEYGEGSIEAKDVLIERNLRLVAHIVKKYNMKDNEDLISVGTVGLIKGIVTFNPQKGTKLATYASRCIENEILMYLRSMKKYGKEVFMQEPIGVDKEGNKVTIEDKLGDESYSIDDAVNLKMQIQKLYETIKKCLSNREQTVIELRYGLLTGDELTQREIASFLNISRSYVSRIEKKALKKLYKEMEKADG